MAPISVVQKLNAQMNKEFYASNLCLYYSDWCAQQSLNGSATVLRQQAQHNVTQMMRLFDYLKQTGANPVLGALKSVKPDCLSLEAIFHQMQEELTGRRAALTRLMSEAHTARDEATLAMLGEFENELRQDEALLETILRELASARKAGLCAEEADQRLLGMMEQMQ
ncbi:non-heme ferritin-like protein [Cronobacter muytjensii]|uniref:non-heme ferritin-like protein n=1 Tax=Cronobacter TaxID=413496 RepID=UPI0012A0470E|nr:MULTISPECIES: non-heme ferritin-like protein [Cronobacter]EKS1847110.1 non-heme ferritin-like protein [Cronobacter muytjensii]ELY2496164.1 non-heme ferritin-like protein [Cronobacter muytjensii]ELY3984859.1 non-heme ferritin-like protein [Cronobacter muytjensii]ELY4518709.1 non-heme ferritin-like protein [Cronobacter muytjensii]ELY4664279.1 non-heme ferritin-like protein [Cronobacter muytjensii]